jgi:ATP-binding cassette subfamily B multidrug efflux pump
MADFFETDEITKGYDSRIAARILSYIKPYTSLLIAAIAALVIGTAGELLVPVLIRNTVDDAMMVSWVRLDSGLADQAEGKEMKLGYRDPIIQGRRYIKAKRLGVLTAAERKNLETSGTLDATPRYLFSLNPEDHEQTAFIAANAGLFSIEGNWASILIDDLKRLPAADAKIIRKQDAARIAGNAGLLLLALTLVLSAVFAQIFTASLIGQKIMKDLRIELFRHTSSRSLAYLSRQPVGRIVTRLTSDIETINQFFTDVLGAFLKDASLMIGVLVVLFALDRRLALITIASLPPVLILTLITRTRARDAFRRQRMWLSKVNAFISERIAGMAVVKLFAGELRAQKEFEHRDEELMKANMGEMYVFATFRPLVDLFSSTSVAVIIYFGSGLFGVQLISLGTLIAFTNLIRMFYSPVQDMAEKYTLLQSAMAGGERVFKLLDADDRIPDNPKQAMPKKVEGSIDFDRVSFAYKGEEWILKDMSFQVRPGEMVAIVGPTGAGKTTIANLITRLWDTQKGDIRLDGIPVRDLPLQGLRKAVQPVLQDVFLFSGTIEDNIRLGTDVSPERMRLAAAAVHADEFIDRLPDGYGTKLSEGATNLSQGQRQLLSFARVLAHDPAVIILDEATSSVDTETERMIQRGLEALLEHRTSLVIAHRLSTIKHADRILVVAAGRIAEQGTHEELLARQGLYWNLYRLQYGGA